MSLAVVVEEVKERTGIEEKVLGIKEAECREETCVKNTVEEKIEIAKPLVMCINKFNFLYFGIVPKGPNCGICSWDEKNSYCRNYVPKQVYDFGRQHFMEHTMGGE